MIGQQGFFNWSFDNICWYSFLNYLSDFSDYSMPVLRTSNFGIFLRASKHVFPQKWAFLSSHWNINQEWDGKDLTEFKERQVFISVLILQRQSNFRCLQRWCLVLSTAMYGWGTRDTLGRATSFIGTTVSCSYQQCFYTLLTSDIVNTAIQLLSREICKLMVSDNFQRSNQLTDQHGGSIRSSTLSLTPLTLCQFALKYMIKGLSVCFLPWKGNFSSGKSLL